MLRPSLAWDIQHRAPAAGNAGRMLMRRMCEVLVIAIARPAKKMNDDWVHGSAARVEVELVPARDPPGTAAVAV